ncbi:MAG: inositol monophosphatase family protein [Bryobacteraceae bacterium]|nr:inositol monophosphatase family protein [Bryobacteraceae bacterium]
MPYEREMEVCRRAASVAGEIALRYHRSGLTPEEKDDLSPVTIADRECERAIASLLTEVFPEDGLLGEEGAARESRSGRRWIIDPIDGTRDFVRGNHLFANLIALEAGGEVVAGVANFPALGALYLAGKGHGAWRDGVRLQVAETASPSKAVLCYQGLNNVAPAMRGTLLDWFSQFWAVRSMGGALDASFVAEGQADIWIEHGAKAWDLAPLKILVEEAGGRYFNFDGGSSIYAGNCVCTNPNLEAVVRRFFGLL